MNRKYLSTIPCLVGLLAGMLATAPAATAAVPVPMLEPPPSGWSWEYAELAVKIAAEVFGYFEKSSRHIVVSRPMITRAAVQRVGRLEVMAVDAVTETDIAVSNKRGEVNGHVTVPVKIKFYVNLWDLGSQDCQYDATNHRLTVRMPAIEFPDDDMVIHTDRAELTVWSNRWLSVLDRTWVETMKVCLLQVDVHSSAREYARTCLDRARDRGRKELADVLQTTLRAVVPDLVVLIVDP